VFKTFLSFLGAVQIVIKKMFHHVGFKLLISKWLEGFLLIFYLKG
jgi:hypothetical protein